MVASFSLHDALSAYTLSTDCSSSGGLHKGKKHALLEDKSHSSASFGCGAQPEGVHERFAQIPAPWPPKGGISAKVYLSKAVHSRRFGATELGYVRVVGRRRVGTELPEPIVSVPTLYTKHRSFAAMINCKNGGCGEPGRSTVARGFLSDAPR